MLTLVLLPGLDGSGTLFDDFVEALGPEHQITIVRYPPDESFGYPDLEAVAFAAIPDNGPIVILGESFSGPIAISLAAAFPSRIKGLILCCSFVRNPHPSMHFFSPFINHLPFFPMVPVPLTEFLLGRFSTRQLRSSLTNAIENVSTRAIRARLLAVVEVDVSAKLGSLTMPILYLRASEDRLVPSSASDLVREIRPHTAVVTVDAPHFLLQSAPAAAAQVVGAFMREISG